MKYQKLINCRTVLQTNYLNLEQKIGLRWMMTHVGRIKPIVILNLKP